MRDRYARHLQSLLDPSALPPVMHAKAAPLTALMRAPAEAPQPMVGAYPISPELNGNQYAIFLLHIAAEIEHTLMAEYLYAGYTLGGAKVDPKYHETILRWQETILGIAKEEMGHLVTVQNVLRLISGPVSFERQDVPFDARFYPFFFTLERLTLDSLAKYVYAEKPPDWTGPLADEITERAQQANNGAPLNAVGGLYRLMIETIGDPNTLPDSAFRPDSVTYQASWSEWGRGYAHGSRGNLYNPARPTTPDLIIRVCNDRASAVEALQAIADQGEVAYQGEESHWKRFLDIYVEWKAILEKDKHFDPSRPVATNPFVTDALPEKQRKGKVTWKPDEANEITHPVTFYWAHLFNVRYRLLLTGLTHSFSLRGSLASTTRTTARGDVITLIFSEMYKIRALSGLLVAQPLRSDTPVEDVAAGPPFQMPYTLNIPDREQDRWRWYRDMLDASRTILTTLLTIDDDEQRVRFAKAMIDADDQELVVINRIIATEEKAAEVTQ